LGSFRSRRLAIERWKALSEPLFEERVSYNSTTYAKKKEIPPAAYLKSGGEGLLAKAGMRSKEPLSPATKKQDHNDQNVL